MSTFSLALSLALVGSLAIASAGKSWPPAPEPTPEPPMAEGPKAEVYSQAEDLVAAVEAMGPEPELSPVRIPDGWKDSWKAPFIFAADKITLTRLPFVNETNNDKASAVFSYWATPGHIVWKLTVMKVDNFTGAHLHRDHPGTAIDPIVQHLVPKFKPGRGDFIAPINIKKIRVFVGSFGIEELRRTLGVTSIKQFLTEFVATNQIFVEVHGPNTIPILRGFLNV